MLGMVLFGEVWFGFILIFIFAVVLGAVEYGEVWFIFKISFGEVWYCGVMYCKVRQGKKIKWKQK
ncbi:hypothetical protein LCGC14_1893580 [marine sediment metagenome]|uniref:Uncharacterized protein n=1 Tax=marine sediment metagenome TaxID=412755 RepID=A0A0F9IWT5_9ZZZZ